MDEYLQGSDPDEALIIGRHESTRLYQRECGHRSPLSPAPVCGATRRYPKACRAHRYGVVRQNRSVADDPGRACRCGVTLRRRSADVGGCRRSRGDPSGLEEAAAHVFRLPRDAEGGRPRCRADRHARPLARAPDDRGGAVGLDVWVQKPISVDVVEGQAMLAAARKYKRVVQVGMQRRSTPHLVTRARPRHPRRTARHGRSRRDLLLLPHAGDRESSRHAAAGVSRLRDVDRAGADAAVQRARAPAQLARVHGVRQRHRRRHVRAHARHGALDAGPRHAGAHQLPRAASWSTRRARRTSPTRRPPRSTSATCRLCGRIASTATRRIRSIRGARPSTATRAR